MRYCEIDGVINCSFFKNHLRVMLYCFKQCLFYLTQCLATLYRCLKPCLHFINLQLEPVYRFLGRQLVFAIYNIQASGFEKIPDTGPVLLISNHVSYVDGLIISALCKRRVRFIIDNTIYHKPIVNYFMTLSRAIPISTRKELIGNAMAEISAGLKAGDVICIFPEGRLTYTGFMSHFRPGVEWIIRHDPTPIYPIVLDGLWGSVFSRKYSGSLQRFLPRLKRLKVSAVCGDMVRPEEVTIDQLHLVMLDLRGKLPKRHP